MNRIGIAMVLMLLAGCDSSGQQNKAVDQDVRQEAAAPLPKAQALALMKQRYENYKKIGDANKAIGRELKAENPDLDRIRTGAATIARLAPQVPSWFPAGTGPDVGETEALPAIWQWPEDFAAKARALREAAAAFNAAAQGRDLAAIRAAHAELGKSCKSCHDQFRE